MALTPKQVAANERAMQKARRLLESASEGVLDSTDDITRNEALPAAGGSPGRPGSAPGWLEAVAAGDFTGIPEGLRFVDSQPFAQLIDGYALSQWMGYGELGDFANARSGEA